MLKHFSFRVFVGALALLMVSWSARAASPQLTRILPRGGQRGTEVVLTFEGQRLADAQEVFVYEPGVTVSKVEQPSRLRIFGLHMALTCARASLLI